MARADHAAPSHAPPRAAAAGATKQLRRRLVVPHLVLGLVELGIIGYPLWESWILDPAQRALLLKLGPPVLAVGQALWILLVRRWLLLIERGAPEAVRRAMVTFPLRALALRVGLFAVIGGGMGLALHLEARFPFDSAVAVAVICTSHAFGVSVFRALWYRVRLDAAAPRLAPEVTPLELFADGYKQRLVLAALATGTLGVTAIGAFTWFFIPLNLEHYLRLETYFPLTIAALTAGWWLYWRRLPGPIDRYLAAAAGGGPVEVDAAVHAYRAAQALPYRLAGAKLAFWAAGEVLLVVQGVLFFALDLENAALMGGEALVVTIGVALYEALWHRATLRPLLRHVAERQRPSPDRIRTPLSLRSKIMAAFGALTIFACGLSLFWSFTQYKTLATVFIQRECDVRLDALLDDLHQLGERQGSLGQAQILAVLAGAAAQVTPLGSVHDHAVLYFLSPEPEARAIPVGGPVAGVVGGERGALPLPWAGEALLRRLDRGHMELSSLQLTGSYARLYLRGTDGAPRDLGAIALLMPGYRGRGPSTVPQIRVLLSFFLVLLIASMGMVVLIARDLARPIRELEQRAGTMARGDLKRPVVTGAAEGDEVGRLTYAFEEMRRALAAKLDSSEEANLTLEAEVSRRTAELERRNRELNLALERLKRAQDELVRSEKLASMGRLVAGIAHEINNPVNAVVNTAGPLESTLAELSDHGVDPEVVGDMRGMIGVIQRGARRTKEIVQALHNYSRGDDDRVVELDLRRSIDDALDLLRHQLKQGITVERDFGDVTRVLGRSTLNQVFMNLLANAAQAIARSGRGGTIRVSAAREGEGPGKKVRIRVADDGPGIPPEVLPRIFDPFFTTKDVGEGSGLGLSIVHGIVERHGGTIEVESEVGRGTCFTVSLPEPARAAAG